VFELNLPNVLTVFRILRSGAAVEPVAHRDVAG
jgi:hypothetical protein